jgi:site-specific DNA-methyltransferase (adenine-specific)
MAARVECKIGERFNVLNHIVWDKGRLSRMAGKEDERLRQFVPMSERIIFAEHFGSDNVAKGEAGYQAKCDELRGFVFEPLLRYMIAEFDAARLTRKEVDQHFGTANVSQYWLQPRGFIIPTEEKYAGLQILRQHHFRREYEDLRREYESLRREFEEQRPQFESLRMEYESLRRPFFLKQEEQHTDIWSFDSPPNATDRHPCAKPIDLLEHIITASTRPGATVRDDFMGGGSTGVACIRTGRRFIGIERDAGTFATARRRLENELRQGLLPLTNNDKTTGGEQ